MKQAIKSTTGPKTPPSNESSTTRGKVISYKIKVDTTALDVALDVALDKLREMERIFDKLNL